MSNDIIRAKTKGNYRRHPGVKGPRPDRKQTRREDAEQRLAAYQALPLEEKKRRNPKKFEES